MWDARTPAAGQQAADLTLLDELGRPIRLSAIPAPLLAIVFRSPDDEASQRLLRDCRDMTLALRKRGVSICGISQAEPSTLAYLRSERGLGFPLLADPGGGELAQWGLADANALLLVDRDLRVLQRDQGDRPPADALLSYLRRGRLRSRRPPLLARLADFFRWLPHALHARHP
jgi:peroxiredoxin